MLRLRLQICHGLNICERRLITRTGFLKPSYLMWSFLCKSGCKLVKSLSKEEMRTFASTERKQLQCRLQQVSALVYTGSQRGCVSIHGQLCVCFLCHQGNTKTTEWISMKLSRTQHEAGWRAQNWDFCVCMKGLFFFFFKEISINFPGNNALVTLFTDGVKSFSCSFSLISY